MSFDIDRIILNLRKTVDDPKIINNTRTQIINLNKNINDLSIIDEEHKTSFLQRLIYIKNISDIKLIDDEVNQFKKIEKDKSSLREYNKYNKEYEIPSDVDIWVLKSIPYEDKKELVDMIRSYDPYQPNEELRDKINFKYEKMIAISNASRTYQQKHKKDSILPTVENIMSLKFVPYEEQKELISMIDIYYMDDSFTFSEKLYLKNKIIFKYKNLLSIKKSSRKSQQLYKRARQIDVMDYKDFLELPDISEDDFNHLVKQSDEAYEKKLDDYMFGVKSFKRIRHEIDNKAYHAPNEFSVLKKITESGLPQIYKEKLYSMLNDNDYAGESSKKMDFITLAISIPYNKLSYNIPKNIKEFHYKFRNILDKELFGMNKTKEELITTISCKAYTSNSKYKAICLLGPPGTGKTTIARTIAQAFGIPFEQISMNTITCGSDLTGHNYTYVGSQPGMITKALINMKCNNGVLFLDEIDKINSGHNDSVFNTLMNILDFSQNHEFVDNYFQDFKIDLSNLLIICSANNAQNLGYILSDRIKLIQVPGYNKEEKINICKKITEKILIELELNKKDIIIPNEIYSYLVDKDDEINKNSGDSEKSGVRGLEHIMKHILERIKILCFGKDMSDMSYYVSDFELPYTLQIKDVNLFLTNYGTLGKGRIDIIEKINNSLLTKENKIELRSMLANTHESDSHDYPKVMNFINQALSLPFNKIKYDIPDSTKELYFRFKKLLDEKLFGMEKAKEELVTALCCKFKNPNSKYKAIALVGPPGTGKTTIARTIANVFSVPFEQISMNTVSRGSDLTGHNFTYIGSQPGMIAKSLIKMKCNNGVLFLDEIDKVNNNSNDDAYNTLMTILDFSQNNEFTDNYFQNIKLDLSNLFIVCSLNNIEKLDKILADRIKFIHIDGYTKDEKIKIGYNMKTKICKEYNISEKDIIVTEETMKYILREIEENEKRIGKMEHGGVRGLESALKHIFERLRILMDTVDEDMSNQISYHIKDFKLPHTLTSTNVDVLLKNFMAKDDVSDVVRNMFI
jgi:ATP-dependent Lon protease